MTGKQIEALMKTLPPMIMFRFWKPWQKRLYSELTCREMINSCLVYDDIVRFYKDGKFGEFAERHRKELGDERVLELLHEQETDFSHAKVTVGSSTDCDGVSYNSIQWADEMLPK